MSSYNVWISPSIIVFCSCNGIYWQLVPLLLKLTISNHRSCFFCPSKAHISLEWTFNKPIQPINSSIILWRPLSYNYSRSVCHSLSLFLQAPATWCYGKHIERLKSGCILANMGHSNQEIDLEAFKDLRKEKIRKNVSHIFLPNGRRIILMAEVGSHTSCLLKYLFIFFVCVFVCSWFRVVSWTSVVPGLLLLSCLSHVPRRWVGLGDAVVVWVAACIWRTNVVLPQ